MMIMQLEHALNQIFKRVRENVFAEPSCVKLPELISFVECETFVLFILRGSRTERHSSSDHSKENDRCCKKVNRLTFIRQLLVLLWCHILRSSQHCRKVILSTIDRSCIAKVSYLNIKILTHKYIFQLQVPVGQSFGMAVINTIEDLFEIVAGNLFA